MKRTVPSRAFALLVALLVLVGARPILDAADKPPAPPASLPVCDRVRFQPAPDGPAMVGGSIEGSNVSRSEGFVKLAEISAAAPAGGWGEMKFDNQRIYRWLRFVGPAGAQGKIGKVEFYAGDRRLAADSPGNGIRVHTFVNDAEDERSITFDVLEAATQRPSFKPELTEQDGPMEVTLSGPRDAVIHYTLDGSWPGAFRGAVYAGPIHLEKTTTVSAVAIQADRAPSLPVTQTYLLRGTSRPGLESAHVGNSLTGTTSGFWRYARTAGYDHKSVAFLRPGALTRELWALASGTFAEDKLASAKEAQARGRGTPPWAEFWGKVGKVDLLTMQPRDFDLEKEVASEIALIKLFREKSPDLQPWLYCEWVELKRERPSDRGQVPSYEMSKTFPALTWEESMSAMLLYVEELQHRLTAQFREGKRPRILPTALAMGWIKHKIDHGEFPGVKPGSFYSLLFNDQVHPAASPVNGSANGAYLVDLTWFGAFYREAPEGKVLPIETTYTPEQARIVERLAWDVVRNYPDCGLYEEGTQPCGHPEFNNDGKIITLKSATSGAWFRYTLDGTTPTRTRGYVYCGAISVQPGIQVKAIAYQSGMADSEVAALPPAEKTAAGPLTPVLQSLLDKGIVAGAVALVADKDKVLDVETAGYSALSTKEPMRENDLFWIASMSKSLTATALMMLVDEGKVSLGDPVEKYLPEFKDQSVEQEGIEHHPPAHPITVREIMSHTSGLVLASDKSLQRTQSLKENVIDYASKPLRQEPGTKYEYNNCGINTGGRIIEVVSGQTYADFMQTRLFGPLGMKDTTFWPNEEQAHRLAHSARSNPDKTALEEVKLDANVTPDLIAKLGGGVSVPAAMIGEMGVGIAASYARHYGEPAGGFFSTARDLGTLCQMLLSGGVHHGKRYLSEKAIAEMSSIQTGKVPVTPQEAYGIGWSVKLRDDEGLSSGSFGHRGARRPCMWIDPKNGLAVVLLVERFDMTGDEQKGMYGPVLRAAIESYGKAR